MIQAMKQKSDKEAMAKQLHEEELARLRQQKAEKEALERKIAEQHALQVQKEKAAKAALEQKIAQDKLVQKQKEAQQLAEQQRIEARKKALEAQKKQEESQQQSKKNTPNTEALIFKASTQTYQKFGTSEIHGHVVYLTPSGQEIGLENTKIYLVPQNSTTNYWYTNYYLKNKTSASLSGRTVHYINATHLNLERNFAFYGLSTGTYYIIIESSYPSSIAKNKKVYIAKKINVEKYKKIMTVFSKRL